MNTVNNDFRQLIVEDFMGVIIVLNCCLILSSIILILEIIIKIFDILIEFLIFEFLIEFNI